jgi:hypothetical protein
MTPKITRLSGGMTRLLLVCTFSLLAPSCGSLPESQVDNPWAQAALFPIQVVPNIVMATATCLVGPFVRLARDEDPGNLCGISVLFAPVLGICLGVAYAAHGVPFWVIPDAILYDGSDEPDKALKPPDSTSQTR